MRVCFGVVNALLGVTVAFWSYDCVLGSRLLLERHNCLQKGQKWDGEVLVHANVPIPAAYPQIGGQLRIGAPERGTLQVPLIWFIHVKSAHVAAAGNGSELDFRGGL